MSKYATHEYDLFVSYAPDDRGWVNGYLLDALRSAQIKVISEADFELGAPRLAEFERAVQQSARTLLVLTPAAVTETFSQFVAILVQSYGLESGTWPVIPLLLKPVELPPRLALLTPLDVTEPEMWPAAVDRLCANVQKSPPARSARPPCPYPGMRAFGEQEAGAFHGRDAEVEDLLQRLRRHPFAAVIGASGSGKSSLVFAGLIPALRRSGLFGEGEWLVRSLRPGDHPLTALHLALGVADAGQFIPATLLATEKSARLLLVVDQFEEVFTQGASERDVFFAAIQRITSLRDCFVVLTVRADFFDDLLTSALWPLIQPHRLEIAPLGAAGLRAAIVKPAEDVGVFIESALVERLVAGSVGQPGLLPFVQEVMVRLWEKLERRYLPLRAYEALVLPLAGYSDNERESIIRAIALLADEIIHRLSPQQQSIARRILLRLVQFGEGRDDTRRQQPVSALQAAGDDAALFDHTLNYLAENRLLVLSGAQGSEPRVDLAHEAMLTGWSMLRGWVKEGKEVEVTRRRYEQQAQEWEVLGQGKRGLLSALDFTELQRWVESPAGQAAGLTKTLLAWIDACRKEVKSQRFRGLIVSSLVIGLSLLIVISVLVVWATLNPVVTGWHVASALPISRVEPGDGQSNLRIRLTPGDPDRVYLLDSGKSELFQSEDGGNTWREITPDEPGIADVVVSMDEVCLLRSKSLACRPIGDDGWSSLLLPETGADVSATALAVDPQNKERLAVGYSNGQIDLSEDHGEKWRTVVIVAKTSAIHRLGFSGDQMVVLSGAASNVPLVIDLDSGDTSLIDPEPVWPGSANDISIPSSLGRFLVATGESGIVDADVGSVGWSPYPDPPPGAVLSLAAWADDIYVIDAELVHCNRVWTWLQLNWWRSKLGLHIPCTNRS